MHCKHVSTSENSSYEADMASELAVMQPDYLPDCESKHQRILNRSISVCIEVSMSKLVEPGGSGDLRVQDACGCL